MADGLRKELTDMEGRDVGRLAEKRLEAWAAEMGLQCERVQYDIGGWDYYLNDPLLRSSSIAGIQTLDGAPAPFQCLVQVKGTDQNSKRTEPIALSNWRRLALCPLPTFFLVVNFAGNADPKDASLVHVDDHWIAKVLKRLRSLGEDDVERLNKTTMSLRWNNESRLEAPSMQALWRRIVQSIGSDLGAYVHQKQQWLANVGFEDSRYRWQSEMTASSAEELWGKVTALALGLESELNMTSFAVEEVRFGQPRRVSTGHGQGTLRLEHPPISGVTHVCIWTKTRRSLLRFQCAALDPRRLFPMIPEEHVRGRLVAPFVDFIIHPAKRRLKISVNLPADDEPFHLSSGAQAAQLYLLLSRGDHELSVSVSSSGGTDLMELGSLPERAADPVLEAAFGVLDAGWRIVRHSALVADPVVTLAAMFEDGDGIRCLSALMTSDLGASFRSVDAALHERLQTLNGPIVVGAAARLGGHVISVALSFERTTTFARDHSMVSIPGDGFTRSIAFHSFYPSEYWDPDQFLTDVSEYCAQHGGLPMHIANSLPSRPTMSAAEET
jgi:hypothetical protein